MFALEDLLGESAGALELYAQLQDGSFTDVQAAHFRQNPEQLDADRVMDIPTTYEKLRAKFVAMEQFVAERTSQIQALESEIKKLCDELGEDVAVVKSSVTVTETMKPLSTDLIKVLQHVEGQLKSLKGRREALIHEQANKLRALWAQLETPSSHTEQFIKQHRGRSVQVIKDCEAEIRRLEAEKLTRVRELVLAFRNKIRTCWEELSVSDLDRKMFESRYDYDQNTFSDEILEQHRTLHASLERMVVSAQPVISAIKDYQVLVQEKESYVTLTSNKERLLDRRYNMRAEEALRRKAEKLPKAMENLISMLEAWKVSNNNQPLMYQGVDFLATLLEIKQAEEEAKLAKKRNLSSATSSSMLRSNVNVNHGTSVSSSTQRLTAKLATTNTETSSSSLYTDINSLKTPSKPFSNSKRSIAPDTTGKTALKNHAAGSELATPSRPRSQSKEPATTGKPITSRARTQSASEQRKLESNRAAADKENLGSVAE